jgi:hypothetical protein
MEEEKTEDNVRVVAQEAPVELLPESETEYSYAEYLLFDGRIDEENYGRIMKKAQEDSQAGIVADFAIRQTKISADISGVSLDAIRDKTGIDPRCIYTILQQDERSDDPKRHHGLISDQKLLVESLRMLGQGRALQAIMDRHSHINFGKAPTV